MADEKSFNATAYKNQFAKEHYSSCSLQVRKGNRFKIKFRASFLGKSTNQYILDCILTEMRRNGWADKLKGLDL